MLEDQNALENQTEKPAKTESASVITKLLLLVAIVFALMKRGVPLMNNMVAEFKGTQNGKQQSRGLTLCKDEFGIYIYEDVTGARQIRGCQPN
jgi:hypothetical protein